MINRNGDAVANWYKTHRSQLSGHGIWLDGGEPGRVAPSAFKAARLRILFCRLSSYRDVRPSLSHRLLYWAATTVPGVYPDLAWLPPHRDASLMTAAGIPWWTASGAKQPPAAFDVVAIGISTPQEALNLPAALRHSGLALSHAERMTTPLQPLVVLGGQAAASVPFIHGDASEAHGSGGLVDAVCLGDGIEWLRDFLVLCLDTPPGPTHKAAILSHLARHVPGSYIPSGILHTHLPSGALSLSTIDPALPLPVLHRTDSPDSWTTGYDGAYIPFDEEDQEETLPLSFGCRYRCRFCQTGWIRGAILPTGDAPLIQCATRLKGAMAASDLNLLASDACSVPDLDRLSTTLLGLFRHVSVKSLALASLARVDSASAIRLLDKKEFTLGVEGISRGLRRWLGKPASAETLVTALSRSASAGIRQLKLFFILTGRETVADISEFRDWLEKARGLLSSRIVASFTPLFHAPFTPLQFAEIRPAAPVRIDSIRQAATRAGAEFRLSARPEEIHLINLLCRAGRRGTPTLLHLALHQGFRYEDSIPPGALDAARAHLAAGGITEPSLVRDMTDAVLPWDDIQAGHSRDQLLESARLAAGTAAGGPAASTTDLAEASHPPPPRASAPPTPLRQPAEATLAAWVNLEPEDAWRPDATLARGLLRTQFSRRPELASAYRGSPRLIRFPFASGPALLQAAFLADLQQPLDSAPAGAVPESPWFLVRLESTASAALTNLLRLRRIPFQSRRRAPNLWHIVAPTHRSPTGLAAVIEAPDACRLLATPSLHNWLHSGSRNSLKANFESLAGGGITEAIYSLDPRKCRSCGSRPLIPLYPSTSALPADCPANYLANYLANCLANCLCAH